MIIKLKSFSLSNLDFFCAFVAFLFVIYLHLPGYAYYDTFLQMDAAKIIEQGSRVGLTDLHPLIMSLMMAFFDKLGNPLAGMLVFHNLMFWMGLLLFVKSFDISPFRRGVLLIIIGFFPPIFSPMGAILKDPAMTASLVLSSGMIFYGLKRSKLSWFAISVLFLFYGSSVRVNAGIAILPFLLVLVFYFKTVRDKVVQSISLIKGIVITFVILFFIVWANYLLTYKILGAKHRHHHQQLMLYDLVGISIQIQENLVPEHFMWAPPRSLDQIKAIHQSESCMYLFALRDVSELLKESQDRIELKKLGTLWRDSIKQNFGAYIHHRLKLTSLLLGLSGDPVCWPVFREIGPNTYGFKHNRRPGHITIFNLLENISNSIIFRGYIYILISLIGLGISVYYVCFKKRHYFFTALILFMSSLLYALPYLVIGLACDFRYLHWTITGTCLGLVSLIISGFFGQKDTNVKLL